jgi:hypothetical protein
MRVFNSGFDSYDPTVSNFDPTISRRVNNADGDTGNAGYGVQQAKPGQKMQINMSFTNNTASQMVGELFYWINSVTKVLKPELVVGNYKMIPETSHEGIRAAAANTGGTVSWGQNGDLNYRGNDATPDPLFTIGCSEIPYRSIFEASAILPFRISFIRETVTTDAQISNKITWLFRTIAGGVKSNTVSPRSFFRPNQFQNFTIDISVELDINAYSGIQLPVNAGERVDFALFVNFWTSQDLG